MLAKLALQKPALLVLDEPTNHLDIEMRIALANALDTFGGAIVVVAHDQHLLRQCVNEFWLIRDGQITTYRGDLDDYEATLRAAEDLQVRAGSHTARTKRQLRALQRKQKSALEQELRRIEHSLEEISAEKQSLTVRLSRSQDFGTLGSQRIERSSRAAQRRYSGDNSYGSQVVLDYREAGSVH